MEDSCVIAQPIRLQNLHAFGRNLAQFLRCSITEDNFEKFSLNFSNLSIEVLLIFFFFVFEALIAFFFFFLSVLALLGVYLPWQTFISSFVLI